MPLRALHGPPCTFSIYFFFRLPSGARKNARENDGDALVANLSLSIFPSAILLN